MTSVPCTLARMKLYGTTTSPFVRRVRVVAAEVGEPVERIDTAPDAGQAQLREVSPIRKVPVAVIDGRTIYDSRVINEWLTTTRGFHGLAPAHDRWREEKATLSERNAPLGLLIPPGSVWTDIAADLPRFPVIAVTIPKYADGRASSIARLLRERDNYQGEIRVMGDYIIDQMPFMRRVGIDAFDVTNPNIIKGLERGDWPEVTDYLQPAYDGDEIFGLRIEGVARLLERQPMPIYVNEHEAEGTRRVTGASESDLRRMRNGDDLVLGEVRVKLIHTPGHTPGSQCFLVQEAGHPGRLVSGDTLFLGSCGRVDLPGSNPEDMYRSLNEKLKRLPDDTVLYPGHLYSSEPYDTLGNEKRTNPFLRVTSLEQFLVFMGAG